MIVISSESDRPGSLHIGEGDVPFHGLLIGLNQTEFQVLEELGREPRPGLSARGPRSRPEMGSESLKVRLH